MTITLTYTDDAELVRKCRAIMERIEPGPNWRTVGQLAAETGRKAHSISRSLRRASCPIHLKRTTAATGRTIQVDATPELMEFLRK